jgi:hypothetical protein
MLALSARRLQIILTTDRYPAIKSAFLARFSRADLEAWARGQLPSPANRLLLNHMSGAFITRDGWAIARPGRKAA